MSSNRETLHSFYNGAGGRLRRCGEQRGRLPLQHLQLRNALRACRANPCRGVRRNPQPPRTRYVEHEELKDAIDSAPEEFQDFLGALYLTGLRQGEIRRLRKTQIQADRIVVREPKTGKVVSVEITDALRYFILRACSRTPESPFVFTNTKGGPGRSGRYRASHAGSRASPTGRCMTCERKRRQIRRAAWALALVPSSSAHQGRAVVVDTWPKA
jgi:integrase